MSSADSEVRAAFRAMLSAERAGYKLAVALVSTLVSYLVGTAELSDVSELDMSNLLTTAADAWKATHEGEALPNVHRARLELWIANVPATVAVDGDASVAVSPSTASGDEDLASRPRGARPSPPARQPSLASVQERVIRTDGETCVTDRSPEWMHGMGRAMHTGGPAG